MIVVPQYPLWLAGDSEDKDDEGVDERDTDNDEERDADEKVARQNELADSQPVIRVEPDDDDQNCVEAEATEDSLITIPEPNSAELFPDFVILHLRFRPLRPDHPRFYNLLEYGLRMNAAPLSSRTNACLEEGQTSP